MRFARVKIGSVAASSTVPVPVVLPIIGIVISIQESLA
jgi:hypothetical protein